MKLSIWAGFALLGLGMWVAAAQEPESTPDAAPPVAMESSTDPGPTEEQDGRSLSGTQPLTTGGPGLSRSYLQPRVGLFQHIDTNRGVAVTNVSNPNPNDSDVNAVTSLSWGVDLVRLWKTAQLTAFYSGNTRFNSTQAVGNAGGTAVAHQFGVGQSFMFRRWSVSIIDHVSYLPESSFGFNYGGFAPGFGGLQAGAGAIELNPGLDPDQSILTTGASRISNVVVGQANVLLGARSTLTGSGSYGFLRFPGLDAISSDQMQFAVGFDRSLTARDQVGVSYNTGIFKYGGLAAGNRVTAHSLKAAYGRQVTGKMAFQVSGGPQIVNFDSTTAGASTRRTSWTVHTGLTYALQQGTLSLSYGHHVTGGSGVLVGSSNHSLQGSFSRQLTRTIQGSLGVGYSHNSGLRQTNVGQGQTSFDSQYMHIGLGRPLGQLMNLNFNYTLQHQTSASTVCSGAICGGSGLRHSFGIGLSWNLRPIPLGG